MQEKTWKWLVEAANSAPSYTGALARWEGYKHTKHEKWVLEWISRVGGGKGKKKFGLPTYVTVPTVRCSKVTVSPADAPVRRPCGRRH